MTGPRKLESRYVTHTRHRIGILLNLNLQFRHQNHGPPIGAFSWGIVTGDNVKVKGHIPPNAQANFKLHCGMVYDIWVRVWSMVNGQRW